LTSIPSIARPGRHPNCATARRLQTSLSLRLHSASLSWEAFRSSSETGHRIPSWKPCHSPANGVIGKVHDPTCATASPPGRRWDAKASVLSRGSGSMSMGKRSSLTFSWLQLTDSKGPPGSSLTLSPFRSKRRPDADQRLHRYRGALSGATARHRQPHRKGPRPKSTGLAAGTDLNGRARVATVRLASLKLWTCYTGQRRSATRPR